jgi:hypothetical protein
LSQEQEDKRIAERQKERMNSNNNTPRTPYPQRQAYVHEVDKEVGIDDIINYNKLNHDMNVDDDDQIIQMMTIVCLLTWLVVVHQPETSVK